MFKKVKDVFSKRNKSSPKCGITHFDLNDKDIWESLSKCGYMRFYEHPDVKLCVKIIADLVSSMTIFLMKNDNAGDTRVINNLSRIIDINPNPFLTRQKLMQAVVTEFLLFGNSILLPKYSRTSDFNIVEELLEGLYPIPQSKISYVSDTDNGYSIRVDTRVFNYNEFVHFTFNPDCDTPWLGNGLKLYLKDVVESLRNSENIKNDYYTKHFKPNIVFSFEADTAEFTSDESREILHEKWLQTKPGTPYILPAQLIDFKSFTPMSLKEIAINESAVLDKKMIAKMFGIPLFMIGLGDFNETEYNNFIDITISPIVKGMAQELTKKLIISPSYYLKFNLESLKVFKTEEKVTMMLNAKAQGVFNANEVRVAAGFMPIDTPEMNEFNLLENYIPIGKLGDQKKLLQGENENKKTTH